VRRVLRMQPRTVLRLAVILSGVEG